MKNKIIALVLAALIGVAGYGTKSYTVDEAVEVVSDTNKAVESCEALLRGQGFKTSQPAPTATATVKVINQDGEAVSEKPVQ